MTHIERATVELHYVRHLLEYAKEDGATKKEIDTLQRKEEYLEAVVEALSRADNADHLRRATEMVPLTIDQLRGMDGQPVWCEWLLPEDRAVENGKWFIVIIGDKTGLEIKRPADYGNYFLKTEDYGKTWLAYRYPTVATDTDVGSILDEWEPCWTCRNDPCRTCKSSGVDSLGDPCYKCNCEEGAPEYEPSNFCPECGRPLTDKARAMLEKRLRGCDSK